MLHFEQVFPQQNDHVRQLFGLYAKRKRIELNLSRSAVALSLLISNYSYAAIEEGKYALNSKIFEKLTAILFFDEDELIDLSQVAKVRAMNEVAEAMCNEYPA